MNANGEDVAIPCGETACVGSTKFACSSEECAGEGEEAAATSGEKAPASSGCVICLNQSYVGDGRPLQIGIVLTKVRLQCWRTSNARASS